MADLVIVEGVEGVHPADVEVHREAEELERQEGVRVEDKRSLLYVRED